MSPYKRLGSDIANTHFLALFSEQTCHLSKPITRLDDVKQSNPYKLFVKPRAAYFPMKRLDFAKQSNTSWLFVANVPTLDFSDENRLCEAIELYKLLEKPRTAYFPNERLEAAPQNPATLLSHETEPKRRMLKVRCLREKTKSLRLETKIWRRSRPNSCRKPIYKRRYRAYPSKTGFLM
jgi:hypothetical protein